MNKLLSSVILLGLGLLGGYFLQPFVQQQLQAVGLISVSAESGMASDEKKILYWVAPMDANYRRDEPGQSPMGMDLVPVYADEGTEDGVVRISPVVQNNLGVRTERVHKGKLDREINTVGYIAFDEEKLFHLHTRVEGWVEKLHVKATGDVVRKGQKLFELYSPALVNAQEEYLTALKSGNRVLMNASRDRLISLGVNETLVKQLENTRKVRQRIDHFSRNNGFIQELNVREGMFIKPAMDVLTIGQIDTVWVIAEVFERQSGWVEKGQSVDMTVAAYPEKSWKGVVDYIYPTLEEKTRTLRVRIRFDNKDGQLKPNMFSRMTIHSPAAAESLLVKREAIIRNGEMQRVVKALGDGKFQSVEVLTGHENSGYIEVKKGLEFGDQIVTSAQFLIDSESSLTASFERMQEPMPMDEGQMTNQKQAWIEGVVENVMQAHRMLTIKHEPVEALGWPAMSMDFSVNKDIDIKGVKAKDSIRFLVEELEGGGIQITDIVDADTASMSATNKPATDNNQAWVKGRILKINPEESKVTLQHEPVESWGWPEMMMDFPVSSSLDIKQLKQDESLEFLVQKHSSGAIEIIKINKEGL
jgi:Cu(I)/Ag(I) efflux system membrane fusion protein